MDAPDCKITPTKPKRFTTTQQIKIIDEHLLEHPNLPFRQQPRTLNGYEITEINKLWEILTHRLNACGPPERSLRDWKGVWSQRRQRNRKYRYKIKKDQRERHSAIQPTIRTEPDEFNVKSCSNVDGVSGILEPDIVRETFQNAKTISQDLRRSLRKRFPKPKLSKQQLELLDELILKHPDLDDVYWKQHQWKALKCRLNKLGQEKTSKEWRTLFTMRREFAQNIESQRETSCAALPIPTEPDKFNIKSCNNGDGVFGIMEQDVVVETHQNDKNMTTTLTVSQDEFHVNHENLHVLDEKNVHELDDDSVYEDFYELEEENVHVDSHEMYEENNVNNVYEDFHPTNPDEFQVQSQSEQRCQKFCCCCSSRTRTNELLEKQFEMQAKFMQNLTEQLKNLTEQREHYHIEILKILQENNKLPKENLRKIKEENDARELIVEELRLKKIQLKLMKAKSDLKIKKLNL